MIARQIADDDEPAYAPQPRRGGGTRAGRLGAQMRRGHTKRARYRAALRVLLVAFGFTLAVGFYVALVANLTYTDSQLATVETARTKLSDRANLLDQQLQAYRSRARLLRVAAQLGMHPVQDLDVATVPPESAPSQPQSGAMLAAAAGWQPR